jgi:agmatine deiminase
MKSVPADLGWRMPAEWEPHEATWIAWPHHRDDWPGRFGPIPWFYVEVVRQLHRGERVHILVQDADTERRARRALSRAGVDLARVRFFPVPTDRVWTRDHGPIFLTGPGGLALTDWVFNAWAKYPNWQRDNAVPARLAAELGLPSWQPEVQGRPVVLEGGSIDVNGAGLLLTTEECSAPCKSATRAWAAPTWSGSWPITWGCGKCCGWAAGSPATTRTGTSMTWPGSSARARW